jgi:peptidoglycan/LPS O-acetylase OafA/YrhL
METPRRWYQNPCHTTERDRRNQRRVIAWSLLWTLCWVVGALAIDNGWMDAAAAGVAAAVLSALLGVGLLLAYWRFLREADELRRKIEVEALALAFGVGLVGGISYWLLGESGIVAEAEILHVIVLMIVTHSLGILIGSRRMG